MFTLYLYHNGEWFSTVYIYSVFGFTAYGVNKIRKEIERQKAYWQAPITWCLFMGGQDVTDEYITQQIHYGVEALNAR